jgi:hypothetical protein
MSRRFVALALVTTALGSTGLGIARQAPPARDPFARQPQPDRGDRGVSPFTAARSTPGRYTVTTAGTTPLLLDTATGDTWLLLARKDEEPTWKLVRREPVPAPVAPKDRPGADR